MQERIFAKVGVLHMIIAPFPQMGHSVISKPVALNRHSRQEYEIIKGRNKCEDL